MSALHYIGIVFTIIAIVASGIVSAVKKKESQKSRPHPIVTAGLLIGTLVGGSSTIGTAQLAYTYGLSAWWFTLGSGIACLILAVWFVKPLRRMHQPTLVRIIRQEYGAAVGVVTSLLSTAGNFVNIISQLLSATAVLSIVFPGLKLTYMLALSAGFMLFYVAIGGMQGAGISGMLKVFLLYAAMMGCAALVLYQLGGISGVREMRMLLKTRDGLQNLGLFSRGFGIDFGAALSMVLGVLTTQIYAQAIMQEATDRSAATAALIGAALIPPIGVGGILVGLFMRAAVPGMEAKAALTTFVLQYMPPLAGGIILGTLFITVIGTGAGLTLGISSIIQYDVLSRKDIKPWRTNLVMLAVLAIACYLSSGKFGDTILSFAFMSMGLRGAVLFAPLCGALWLPRKIRPAYAMAATIAGPACMMACKLFLRTAFDPLLLSVILTCGIMSIGYLKQPKMPSHNA